MTTTTRSDADEPTAEAQVFAVFNEIGIIHQLSSALLAEALPDGVHPSHFAIVNHLARLGDGKTPIRIAGAMQVTKNTMTHSLRVLEARGFVSVKPNPDDARGKRVFLTEAGRAFRADAIRRVSAMFADIITPEMAELLRRIHPDLTDLRKHLDANRRG